MRIAVVGTGLIGAAAARHLAERGHSVIAIGSSEPAEPANHDGVFASHYDEGRLVSGFSRDPVWRELTRRSVPAYDELTAATEIPILHRVGRLSAFELDAAQRGALEAWAREVDPTGSVVTTFRPGDDGWHDAAPGLRLPAAFDVVVERGDAGYLNPRRLIAAQLARLLASGGEHVDDRVTGLSATDERVAIQTARGGRHGVDRVVVAAGAFANAPGLLPAPLPLRWKTETTIRADVGDDDALSGLPVVTYDVDDPGVDDVYLAPPIRYPDGTVRVKMGANTAHERWPSGVDEIAEWFRHGDADADRPGLERVLRSMLPAVDFGPMATHRCIVTYTPSRYPIIDHAPGDMTGRIVVATGGNGTSAQCSDALGSLAADVAVDDPWPGALPRDLFRAGHSWGAQPRTASRAQRRAAGQC